MSIRDVVNKLPKGRVELSDYVIKKYDHVKDKVEEEPESKSLLENIALESTEKYSKYLGGTTNILNGLGNLTGYSADAWLLYSGDIVGALGGKFLSLALKVPEKLYSVSYGVRTGNYIDMFENILEGAVSYVPGLTFVDQGLDRIIRKRMIKDTVKNFEKGTGIKKSKLKRSSTKSKVDTISVDDVVKDNASDSSDT